MKIDLNLALSLAGCLLAGNLAGFQSLAVYATGETLQHAYTLAGVRV